MTKNITRIVVKPFLENESPIIKNHLKQQYKNKTELSKEAWNLESTNNNPEIAPKIVRRGASVNLAILRCNFCLN